MANFDRVCCVPGCNNPHGNRKLVDTPCQECLDTLNFGEWILKLKKELLACPFCGSNKIILQNTGYKQLQGTRLIYFACLECKCYGPDRITILDAVKAWNKRP